ncbi:hypothetical protein ACOSQ3_030894 [Xanthoceras sorbifolium]
MTRPNGQLEMEHAITQTLLGQRAAPNAVFLSHWSDTVFITPIRSLEREKKKKSIILFTPPRTSGSERGSYSRKKPHSHSKKPSLPPPDHQSKRETERVREKKEKGLSFFRERESE